MRSSPLCSCRKALCSLLSWGTLTLVLLLGGSVVFVLLQPVARDIAWSLKATDREEMRTARTASAATPSQLTPSIPATVWHSLSMESPGTGAGGASPRLAPNFK